MTDVATPSSPPFKEGNGIHPEHPLAAGSDPFNSLSDNSIAVQSPHGLGPGSNVDPVMAKAVDHVLYSDVG
jgi:hypothetical protein